MTESEGYPAIDCWSCIDKSLYGMLALFWGGFCSKHFTITESDTEKYTWLPHDWSPSCLGKSLVEWNEGIVVGFLTTLLRVALRNEWTVGMRPDHFPAPSTSAAHHFGAAQPVNVSGAGGQQSAAGESAGRSAGKGGEEAQGALICRPFDRVRVKAACGDSWTRSALYSVVLLSLLFM
jgi:hypothetical protein